MKRILLTAILLLSVFLGFSQTYNPSQHTVVSTPLGPTGSFPIDARSYMRDGVTYRLYDSTGEILSYLNTSTKRSGSVLYFVNEGGLQVPYWFRGGTNDTNLVRFFKPLEFSRDSLGALIDDSMAAVRADFPVEIDPIYSASSWFSTTNNSANWNTAYGWGNHASAGYLLPADTVNKWLGVGWLTEITSRWKLSDTASKTWDWGDITGHPTFLTGLSNGNGTTYNSGKVDLGGTLSQNTTINGTGFVFKNLSDTNYFNSYLRAYKSVDTSLLTTIATKYLRVGANNNSSSVLLGIDTLFTRGFIKTDRSVRINQPDSAGVSFFLGTFQAADYYVRRKGTTLELGSAGSIYTKIGDKSMYRVLLASGQEWYDNNNTMSMRLRPDGYFELSEKVTADTVRNGFGAIYPKTDGKLYFKNDTGTEYDLTLSGSGADGYVDGGSFNTTTNKLTITQAIASDVDIYIPPSYLLNPKHIDSLLKQKNDSVTVVKSVTVSSANSKISVNTTRTDSTINHQLTINEANFTGIPQSAVTNLATDLAAKAPLASPALTGTPTAPTASAGTNTTQIATTAFVKPAFDSITVHRTEIENLKNGIGVTKTIILACSDMTTALTTGTAKAYFHIPDAAATLIDVKATLITASSSGTVTVDINKNGTSILSTKLTIDASEKTSRTAATSYVFSNTDMSESDEYTVDIDGAGTGAKALQVTFYFQPYTP